MKLLNIGCGNDRHPEPWVNLDNLRTQLREGTPERAHLDGEPNYVEHDIASGPLPFDAETFDGCLCQHVVEHFDAQAGAKLMQNAMHILRPGGVLLVSVPDATYFRRVYHEDAPGNAVRLFGEPIHLPDGETTFFGYALWNRWHKAILTEDALWCYFVRAGFKPGYIHRVNPSVPKDQLTDALGTMRAVLNRPRFSLCMSGVRA